MFSNRSFRFSQEITVISIIAAIFCYAMGYWQFNRYHFKQVYFKTLASQEALGVQDLQPDRIQEQLYGRVQVRGVFDFDNEMVILNRSQGNLSGVKVVTPLALEDGTHILVDRGFLPYQLYHERRYDAWRNPTDDRVEGLVKPSVTKSFFFTPPARRPAGEEGPGRWLRLEIETMAAELPYPVLPVFIEQTKPTSDALTYDEKSVLPPARHLNYAIQWASFGSFGILFGLFLQFRPKRKSAEVKQPQTSETAIKD